MSRQIVTPQNDHPNGIFANEAFQLSIVYTCSFARLDHTRYVLHDYTTRYVCMYTRLDISDDIRHQTSDNNDHNVVR